MAITPSNPALRDDQPLTLVGYAMAQRENADPQMVAVCSYKGRLGVLSEGDLERGISSIEAKNLKESGDKNVAAVCVYHGLTKIITATDAANGGLDAAMAAATAQLKVEEEQIKKNREAEAKFEQALLGAGVGLFTAAAVTEDRGNVHSMRGILGGMQEAAMLDGGASQPKLEQPSVMKSVLGFFGLGGEDQAPATPKPTDRFIVQARLGSNNGMSI
jgi:hypothetical protein